MDSTIGIKIANGEFYPILQEKTGVSVRKRLILTTVHDGQKSMQIDLYKSLVKSMADAQYIGSIVVEKIKPKIKGEPSVELIITSGAGGQFSVDAKDMDSTTPGDRMHLNVSLRSLEEDKRLDKIPDYELEPLSSPPPAGLYAKAQASRQEEKTKKGLPWLLVILLGLALILLCLGVWFFLFREKTQVSSHEERPVGTSKPAPVPQVAESVPEEPVEKAVPAPEPPPEKPVEIIIEEPPIPAAPVIDASIEAAKKPSAGAARPVVSRRRPPVASYKVPQVIPPEGAPYRIRWGDTLWDISEAFYRNAWLYPRIARFNRIRNPDLIIAGRTIRVPPKK